MKKKLALLLCVILTLGLFVGCKGDKPINTVDTSNTSDTSSKIETETVIDDIYEFPKRDYFEYELEEFEQLDISNKYIIADINVGYSSKVKLENFKQYDLKTICTYDRRTTTDPTAYKGLFEIVETGKDKVLEAIKQLKNCEYVKNLRPVGFKKIEKVTEENYSKDSLNSSEKMYYEYTKEEFDKLNFDDEYKLLIDIKPENYDLYLTASDFSGIGAAFLEFEYDKYGTQGTIDLTVTLNEKSSETALNAIKILKNNKFCQRVVPDLKYFVEII